MAAVIVTGPLLPRPAKTLPPELESFMKSSGDDGVILVAFGSMVSSLPPQMLRMLAKVLGRMEQKVLWKIKGIHSFSVSEIEKRNINEVVKCYFYLFMYLFYLFIYLFILFIYFIYLFFSK